MAGRKLPDYDAEARKLFAALNLSPTGAASETSSRLHGYHDLDPIWKHPKSGACVFIGNQAAAKTREILRENRITHIVNCTSDMPLYFKGKDPSISYFRFDIYEFYRKLDLRTHRGVLEFFMPVFRWIDDAVAAGKSVLIHCLAGAHRAGTTGVAYAMHAADLDHRTAITACKSCRPIVDPIDNLTTLLEQLEIARLDAGSTIALRSQADMLSHLERLDERKCFLEEECKRMQLLMSAAGGPHGKMCDRAVSFASGLGKFDQEHNTKVDQLEEEIAPLAYVLDCAGAAAYSDDNLTKDGKGYFTDVDIRLAKLFALQRGWGPAGHQRLLARLKAKT